MRLREYDTRARLIYCKVGGGLEEVDGVWDREVNKDKDE
jgi:hypothetical protein